MEPGKTISDIALATVKFLENELNKALEENDLDKAKFLKKSLVKTLKSYYGI